MQYSLSPLLFFVPSRSDAFARNNTADNPCYPFRPDRPTANGISREPKHYDPTSTSTPIQAFLSPLFGSFSTCSESLAIT